MDTEHDGDPQFHLSNLHKKDSWWGHEPLSEVKRWVHSILAYETPVVDFRVYPSNNYLSEKRPLEGKKKGAYRSSTVLRIRFFSDTWIVIRYSDILVIVFMTVLSPFCMLNRAEAILLSNRSIVDNKHWVDHCILVRRVKDVFCSLDLVQNLQLKEKSYAQHCPLPNKTKNK